MPERRIGKLRRRVDLQLVRDIEIVQNEPPCKAIRRHVGVEVAERGWVGKDPCPRITHQMRANR